MPVKRIQVYNYESFKIRSGYGMNLSCCDCGLTHRVWIKPVGGGWLEVMLARDGRKTCGFRSGHTLRRKIKALARRL